MIAARPQDETHRELQPAALFLSLVTDCLITGAAVYPAREHPSLAQPLGLPGPVAQPYFRQSLSQQLRGLAIHRLSGEGRLQVQSGAQRLVDAGHRRHRFTSVSQCCPDGYCPALMLRIY
ncbi:hypothetical protein TUSST3_38900 [Streptomyces sp. TUS-ST3]|nr:hypothetical protein TUSST3_38900 [Streptomyces sp. TUS-ST3]